ncbi:trehalose-phosphatase [Dokdonella sp. MW10]|uniref:trehalose-phosphatase n=1 Tax=Dokdonella sp. MW10 TaxID=2992926 RepID=UPI003F80E7BE
MTDATIASSPLPAPPPLPAHAALFLDLDGTLLDFALHPQDVVVADTLRTSLARLRHALGGALALVSGRPVAEIDSLLDWRGHAAGLHGAQWRDGDGDLHALAIAPAALDEARRAALAFVETLPTGVFIEDKTDALALHYRLAPEAAAAVALAADDLLRIAGSGFALQHGNRVIELKPAGVDKGVAIARFMSRAPFEGRTPWMLGDDLTDEHAFRHVNERGGTSVIVGPRRPTDARYALATPQAVRDWLAHAANRLDPAPHEENR